MARKTKNYLVSISLVYPCAHGVDSYSDLCWRTFLITYESILKTSRRRGRQQHVIQAGVLFPPPSLTVDNTQIHMLLMSDFPVTASVRFMVWSVWWVSEGQLEVEHDPVILSWLSWRCKCLPDWASLQSSGFKFIQSGFYHINYYFLQKLRMTPRTNFNYNFLEDPFGIFDKLR